MCSVVQLAWQNQTARCRLCQWLTLNTGCSSRKMKLISRKLCSIWSSHWRDYKDGGILWCNTVRSGKYQHFGGKCCTLFLGRRKWRRKVPPKQNRTMRYYVPESASLLCSSCVLPSTQDRNVAMFMFNDDCCLAMAWRQHLRHVHHVYS
jgi:hypothetical protein